MLWCLGGGVGGVVKQQASYRATESKPEQVEEGGEGMCARAKAAVVHIGERLWQCYSTGVGK